MAKRMAPLLPILLAVSVVALASDVSGKWAGTVTLRNGEDVDISFNFQVSGQKLTGTLDSPKGHDTITDGKIEGNTVSFTSEGGDMKWQGTVSGDQITGKLHRNTEGGEQVLDFVVHRAK